MVPRCLLPVLLLAACATSTALERSRAFLRLGDVYNAFRVLDDAREAQLADGEVDPELEQAHLEARKRFLRGRAQERIFQEKEDLALVDLGELAGLDPDYPGLASLRDRALHKKATRLAAGGDELLRRKAYAEALALYLESTDVWPGLPAAEQGIEEVREATARLSARAQQQFLEAVRKLPEFRYIEVQWHAANSVHNIPGRADAAELNARARRENAQRAVARGRDCERAQRFGAALLEYASARRLDATLPGLDDDIARMRRELKAAALVDRAQVDMRAGRFDEARERLAAAFELSLLTRNDIGALQIETNRLEGEARYQAARDLEVLGRKAEALAAFEALVTDWPDGVLDSKARIAALRVDLDGAAKEWAEAEAAEAAGDLARALDHYQNADRFYPGWKDVKARINRLREAIGRGAG